MLLACYSSYSHSEIVYGTSSTTGLNWVMTNILPAYTGLEVNGLVYQYTTIKDAEDDMIVYVQNENAQGDGYIFTFADNFLAAIETAKIALAPSLVFCLVPSKFINNSSILS